MSTHYFKQRFSDFGITAPKLHIVLGSGLATIFDEISSDKKIAKKWQFSGQFKFSEVTGLSASTAPGHAGVFRFYRNLKTKGAICFQVGRLHGYEGLDPRDVVKPVMFSRMSGCENFLLTNASGSLQKKFKVGSAMLISDHVNMTGKNPLYGPNPRDESNKELGPRFPDMSEVYDEKMEHHLKQILTKAKIKVHKGIYLGLQGPTYETPAEVKLFSKWGMGAVGMSTVWESIALKHSGARVGGVSVISNMGCGLVKKEELKHEDVEKEIRKVALPLVKSLFDLGEHYV